MTVWSYLLVDVNFVTCHYYIQQFSHHVALFDSGNWRRTVLGRKLPVGGFWVKYQPERLLPTHYSHSVLLSVILIHCMIATVSIAVVFVVYIILPKVCWWPGLCSYWGFHHDLLAWCHEKSRISFCYNPFVSLEKKYDQINIKGGRLSWVSKKSGYYSFV